MNVSVNSYDLEPSTLFGYGVQIVLNVTSFNKDEIDKLSKTLDKRMKNVYMVFEEDKDE